MPSINFDSFNILQKIIRGLNPKVRRLIFKSFRFFLEFSQINLNRKVGKKYDQCDK